MQDQLEPTHVIEQRRAFRYGCILEAACAGEDLEDFRGWPIRVVNISTGGLGMHASERIEVGALVTLSLHNARQHRLAPVRVRVVHATEQANGTWIMGAAFIRELTEEELRALIA